MLDVDNGPDPMTTSGNGALYTDAGVRTAAAALRPGGRLVYWSAQDNPKFERTLRRAGLTVGTSHVWSRGTSGALPRCSWPTADRRPGPLLAVRAMQPSAPARGFDTSSARSA